MPGVYVGVGLALCGGGVGGRYRQPDGGKLAAADESVTVGFVFVGGVTVVGGGLGHVAAG